MQTTQALTRLQRMVTYLGDPALSTQEVQDLLLWSARADDDGNTPYTVVTVADAAATATLFTVTAPSGPFVALDVGLMLQVEVAGAAGAPLDTTIASYQSATQVTGTVAAGTTVAGAKAVLYRTNPLWVPTYALQWAAAEGWRWKAGKCAERYKFQSDNATFVRDQVFNHCVKMAAEYERRANNEPQSVRTIGNLVLDRLGGGTVPWYYDLLGN